MAISLTVEDGTIKDAKCVMGSVAIRPLISEAVPKALIGTKVGDEAAIKAAGEAAQSEVHPITDVRASANYRVDVIGALARRILRELAEEING